MKVGQVFDYPADQVVTRGQHALDSYFNQTNSFAGLGQASDGLSKEQITRVQKELIRIGYPLQGGADGVRGRTTNKAIEIAKGNLAVNIPAGSAIPNATDKVLLRELDAGNRKLIPSEDQKKAVRALWSGGTTNIQPQPATPPATTPVTTGGGLVTSGGVTDPLAPLAPAGEGFMAKYEAWLKKQAWLPVQLQNPYVAGGIVIGVTALVGYGLYKMSSAAPAPAVAGVGEVDALDAMKQAMRPAPKRRRKSRRKSRKSKK